MKPILTSASAMDKPVYAGGLGETIGRETSPGFWTHIQLPANEGMCLRTYAAIHLRVPDSGIPALDEMIRKSLLMEMAGRALGGLLSNPGGPVQHSPMRGWDITNCTWHDVADVALTSADALIKALEGKQ